MKKLNATLGAATLAAVFVCAAPLAGAQDLTDSMTTQVNRDDDSGKWGLLGLLGLVGLIGLKGKDRENHLHTTAGR